MLFLDFFFKLDTLITFYLDNNSIPKIRDD